MECNIASAARGGGECAARLLASAGAKQHHAQRDLRASIVGRERERGAKVTNRAVVAAASDIPKRRVIADGRVRTLAIDLVSGRLIA